jgi:hypothetical protein
VIVLANVAAKHTTQDAPVEERCRVFASKHSLRKATAAKRRHLRTEHGTSITEGRYSHCGATTHPEGDVWKESSGIYNEYIYIHGSDTYCGGRIKRIEKNLTKPPAQERGQGDLYFLAKCLMDSVMPYTQAAVVLHK